MGEFFAEVGRYLASENNRELLVRLLVQHVWLSLLPVALAIVLAILLCWAGKRWRGVRATILVLSNLLFTVPSLALFVVIPLVIGTQIRDAINVLIPLTIYSTAMLVRPVLVALDAVPAHVIASATAIGYRPMRRFLGVELPLAVPVLAAGTRVASVCNISLVSVGALIGAGGLGVLFIDGFQREYKAPIVIGIVLTLVLALVVDLLLVAMRHWLTPWERAEVSRP